MISTSKIKYINSLKLKKNRILHQVFVAESNKVVLELLSSTYNVIELFATSNWINSNEINDEILVHEVSYKEMERISNLKTASEVLVLVRIPLNNDKINFSGVNIMLDDIKDPGNLGTIIRICDWFGVANIFCSRETVDAYNHKVVQSSMGSISRLKIKYVDLKEFINIIPSDVKIYLTDVGGKDVNEIELYKNSIIIFGNESRGISSKLNNLIDNKIAIRRIGNTDSLNVAISAGIILHKFCS
tara:strand:- start:366 stop:1097 length:732 start_codon:yes stop_codon:yes gene_type:complete